MANVIIYSNSSGNVSVCVPTGELPIEQVMAKDAPSGAIIVDDSTLPQGDGSSFFDAWELANGSVSVNLDKAKAMTKTRLRAERVPLFQAQDVLFQRAQESSSDTSAIVAEKQRLRDVTKLVDVETTLEGLRALKA